MRNNARRSTTDWGADRKTAWLRRYLTNDREIQRLREELAQWQGLLPSIWPAAGGGGERLCGRVDALYAALVAELERRVALRWEIEGAISAIADERYQLVLRLRFIEGCSLEQAAERMHYSNRQVCNLSCSAVAALIIPGAEAGAQTGANAAGGGIKQEDKG